MIKPIIHIAVFLSAMLSTGILNAQTRSASVELDTALILIGEQIRMNLQVNAKAGDTIVFPNFKDTLVKQIEIVEFNGTDTVYDEENIEWMTISRSYQITSFDSGFYAIPPIEVEINQASYLTDPFLISVYTIPIDSIKGIADIKSIQPMELTWKDYLKAYWPYASAILILVLLAWLIYYLIKNRPSIEIEEVKEEELIPAHLHALQRLKDLESRELWQKGQVKNFHVELSEITREYIENRFKILALEQTTEEILHQLRLSELSDDDRQELRRVLMLSDLVKFAKENPLPDENKQALKTCMVWVEKTALVTEEAPAESDEKEVVS